MCPFSINTYAARWEILDCREILGECKASKEGGGENEELHGGCLCEG